MSGEFITHKFPKIKTLKIYTKKDYKLITNKTAVYFIFNRNKKLIYVGQTNYLRIRLWGHFCSINNREQHSNIPIGKAFYFSYLDIDKPDKLYLFEKFYVYHYKPIYNFPYNMQNKHIPVEEN